MVQELTLGISPCPNDTYIFGGLIQGLVAVPGCRLRVELRDVEELNNRALAGDFDICKVSMAAAADMLDQRILLRAGGALGRGVGPLLVARPGTTLQDLQGGVVAIPGRRTTANLLLRLFLRAKGIAFTTRELIFHQVMDEVLSGRAVAGAIIHEGRFTYEERGLARLADLGVWWEEDRGLPLPLGVITLKRSLGHELAVRVNQAIAESLLLARRDPDAVMGFVREHAQEMADSVTREHIKTFVTGFSLDVGREGELACLDLLAESARLSGKDIDLSSAFLPKQDD